MKRNKIPEIRSNRIKGTKKRISSQERRKQVLFQRGLAGAGILLLALIVLIYFNVIHKDSAQVQKRIGTGTEFNIGNPTKQVPEPDLDVQLLTVNEYSRPGIATDGIKGIVIHYTANPGSTAQNNRDYFESLKESRDNKVSSNFIVGLEGEIIQCIPTAEIAYASNSRNNDTISIESCHPDETGKFTRKTEDSLVELVAFLCGKFNLGIEDIIRHYDVTGKICPKYYVETEEAWLQFKSDVAEYIQENGE